MASRSGIGSSLATRSTSPRSSGSRRTRRAPTSAAACSSWLCSWMVSKANLDSLCPGRRQVYPVHADPPRRRGRAGRDHPSRSLPQRRPQPRDQGTRPSGMASVVAAPRRRHPPEEAARQKQHREQILEGNSRPRSMGPARRAARHTASGSATRAPPAATAAICALPAAASRASIRPLSQPPSASMASSSCTAMTTP